MLALLYKGAVGPTTVYYRTTNLPEIYGLEWKIPEGETASSQAPLAAAIIAEDAARLGITVDYSTDPADYPPSEPEPEPEPDAILQLYLDRAGPYAGPAQRVIARWSAYNHVQLANEREGWTQEGIAGLLATPRCQAVVAALTTFGWGLAASLLSAATTEDHPMATPDVVEAYLEAMEAEGCLP